MRLAAPHAAAACAPGRALQPLPAASHLRQRLSQCLLLLAPVPSPSHQALLLTVYEKLVVAEPDNAPLREAVDAVLAR